MHDEPKFSGWSVLYNDLAVPDLPLGIADYSSEVRISFQIDTKNQDL